MHTPRPTIAIETDALTPRERWAMRHLSRQWDLAEGDILARVNIATRAADIIAARRFARRLERGGR